MHKEKNLTKSLFAKVRMAVRSSCFFLASLKSIVVRLYKYNDYNVFVVMIDNVKKINGSRESISQVESTSYCKNVYCSDVPVGAS